MVSLTTVYILSVVLTSIAGMGSAFLGNRIYKGGSNVLPQSINVKIDELSDLLQNQYGYDKQTADKVTDLVKQHMTQYASENIRKSFEERSMELQGYGVDKNTADIVARTELGYMEEITNKSRVNNPPPPSAPPENDVPQKEPTAAPSAPPEEENPSNQLGGLFKY